MQKGREGWSSQVHIMPDITEGTRNRVSSSCYVDICSFYKGLSLKLQEMSGVVGSLFVHSVIHSYMHSLFAGHLLDTCYVPGAPSSGILQRTRPTGSLPVENHFNSGGVWEAKTEERWHTMSGCFHGPLSRPLSTLPHHVWCSRRLTRSPGRVSSPSGFCLAWPVGGRV